MAIDLIVSSEDHKKFFSPAVLEGISWNTKRRSTPGKLSFKVRKDSVLQFGEGSEVRFLHDGNPIFFGFVFQRECSRDGVISVTAYDQLRYLKYQDTWVYREKTASQLIRMIAEDAKLKIGDLEDSRYIIPVRSEDKKSFLEMIENALDLTLQNTKEMFVLYDDFGKLTLKNISSMKVGSGEQYLLIDQESGQDYDYSISIDGNSYNQIKLSYEDKKAGKRETYIAKSGENINKWGLLQYFDTLKEGENGQAKADALLALYNRKTKKLKLKNVLGDDRVRAGSLIVVKLMLEESSIQNFMLVEECSHSYKEGEHWMDLSLRGGEINA